jgi:NTP pyrophosphatase (non-canonical NTP hydrolase)
VLTGSSTENIKITHCWESKEHAESMIAHHIGEISTLLWQTHVDKGFDKIKYSPLEAIALMHSELSEAVEAERNREEPFWIDENGKPEGMATELVDCLIRIINWFTLMDWDLTDVIMKKNEYNKTREMLHGKVK